VCVCSVVLRNHVAQAAIDRAEKGDYDEVKRVLCRLQKPFDDDWPLPSESRIYLFIYCYLCLSGYVVGDAFQHSCNGAVRTYSHSLIFTLIFSEFHSAFAFEQPGSHLGKSEEENENFWNEVFNLVSCIPQNEMVVLAGYMNGHVGSSNVG